jgi:hypothetical protein
MIYWDNNKNNKLKLERDTSFEEISEIILSKQYIDILEHPTRKNQMMFVVELNNYVYVVPFVMDANQNIILKTAYPSRKMNKKYRRKP